MAEFQFVRFALGIVYTQMHSKVAIRAFGVHSFLFL